MIKNIISLFLLILLFNGCEDKTTLEKLSLKLKDNNSTKLPQVKIVEHNITKKEIIKKTSIEKKVNQEKKPLIKKTNYLTLKTLTQKKLKLKFLEEGIKFESYPNKVIILDIFTTWCPPCMDVFPHLVELQKKYKKDIQFIGILMEEGRRDSEILQFKQKYKLNYPITNSKANQTLVNTWGGVSGYPTVIIFDKKGNYFHHFNGAVPHEMLEADIKKVLRK